MLIKPKYAIVFGDKYTIELVDKTSKYNEYPLDRPTFDGMLWVIVSAGANKEQPLEALRKAVMQHVRQLLVNFMDEYAVASTGQITHDDNKPGVLAVYKNMDQIKGGK